MSTVTVVDPEIAAKKNPKVDLDRLRKAQEVQELLREQGYRPEGYRLQSPLDRKATPPILRSRIPQ